MSLALLFRVSDQAISQIVFETTTVLWSALEDHVMPVPTEDVWLSKAAEFEVMWNMPHCLGAIDGKHVRIQVSTSSKVSISKAFL